MAKIITKQFGSKIMKRQIQMKCKLRTNTSNSPVYVGECVDDIEFDLPDEHGCMTLEQDWIRECEKLNNQYPTLNYYIDSQYVEI